mgnify:CR=1 FL=1
MSKICVTVTKRVYGEIILDLSEEEAKEILGKDVSGRTSKNRAQRKAQELLKEEGEGCIHWFDPSPGDDPITVDFGYWIVEE